MTGIIDLDTDFAKQIGFTSDKFDGYLWREDKYIMISLIISKHKGSGHLSELFKKIHSLNYGIKVPTPMPKMEAILQKYGFHKTCEYDGFNKCDVEVWVLEK